MAWQMPGHWNTGVAQITPDMTLGSYSAEQWAAVQQQNWHQWSQWQQQYSQWQSQYGEKYAEQMQTIQPCISVMPPLPPANAAPPPAPPPPEKPPPPPHENNQPLFGQPNPVPAPVPQPQKPLTATSKNIIPAVDTGNTQKWPQATDARNESSQQGVNTEALKKLAEEERLFDIQFEKWEEEIEKWKRENVNHPDRQAYNEYEQKFETCRAQLLERRQVMNQKRARLLGQASATAGNNPIVTGNTSTAATSIQQTPNNVQNLHVQPQSQKTASEQTSNQYQQQDHSKKNYMPNKMLHQHYQNTPPPNYQDNSQYAQYNKNMQLQSAYNRSNNTSNDPQSGYNRNNNNSSNQRDRIEPYYDLNSQNEDHSSSKTSHTNFLPGIDSPKGIPGLDLVPEDKPAQQQPPDVIDITDEVSKAGQLPPDYTNISKGINNILGDEKIMNILSMVRDQGVPAPTVNNQGQYAHKPPYNNNAENYNAPPNNQWDRNQNRSIEHHENAPPNMPFNHRGPGYPHDQGRDHNAQQYPPPRRVNNDNENDWSSEPYNDRNLQFSGPNMHSRGPLLRPNMPPPRPLMQGVRGFQNDSQFPRGPPNGPQSLSGPRGGHSGGYPGGHSGGPPSSHPSGPRSGHPGGLSGHPSGPRSAHPGGPPMGQPSGPRSVDSSGQPSGPRSGHPGGSPMGHPSGPRSVHPGGPPSSHTSSPSSGHPSGLRSGLLSVPPGGHLSGPPNGPSSGPLRGPPIGPQGGQAGPQRCPSEMRTNMPPPRPLMQCLPGQDNENNYSMPPMQGRLDQEDENNYSRGPPGRPMNNNMVNPAMNKPPPPAPPPARIWTEDPQIAPSIIVDYQHKPLRLKAREFIEPVHIFEYNHISKDGDNNKKKFLERDTDELFVRKSRRFEPEDNYRDKRFGPDDLPRQHIQRDYERRYPRDDYREEQRDLRGPPREEYDDRRRFEERLPPREEYYDRRRFDDRGPPPREEFDDRRRLEERHDDRRRDDRERYSRREDFGKDMMRRDDREWDREDLGPRDRQRELRRDDSRNRSRSRDKDSRKRGRSKEVTVSECSTAKKTKEPEKKTEVPKHIVMIDDLLEPPGREMRPEKIVIILRGLPGSGKSYLAKLIRDREAEHGGTARIMSLDDYFMQEGEIEEKDPVTGKIVKKPSLKYEYEAKSEETYLNSLKRAFKRTLTDGYFNFLIYDTANETLRSYADIWNFARQNGFQVYICTMELDVQTCFKRNIHGRTLGDIQVIATRFFETPDHHIQLDATTLLQSAAITDVQMEDIDDEVIMEDAQEPEVESSFTSKWEKLDDAAQLARLDGTSKPLRPSQPSMEDYLQLDDWKPTTAKPGKKTVRWADIEESREQEKMRAIGFVVGQTDWNRMTDPTMGSSALTQTKYIERVKRN